MTLSSGGSIDHAIPRSGGGRGAKERRLLTVRGVVQGVGFRPFVWRLAHEHDIAGLTRNTTDGLIVEVEGPPQALDDFARDLVERAPSLARVVSMSVDSLDVTGDCEFRIEASQVTGKTLQEPPADAVVCAACLGELNDPSDRRHRYPFVNCTGCGPRFTIIDDLPYDRARTTMRHFPMCVACRREYEDPSDRRFHAEPVACPECGPRLWVTDASGEVIWGDPVDIAAAALRHGAVVAIKGLGGFQLACDGTDEVAVGLLRERKRRPAKPFAVMTADLAAVRSVAELDDASAEQLGSAAGPIVLLPCAEGSVLAAAVIAGLDEVGVMLPSTPLHHLLLAEVGRPLVMTSGNVSDEPICSENDEAVARLGTIADLFLLHDRGIASRYDDSVVRTGATVRAGRGLAPVSLPMPEAAAPGVAFGAHLKNTFALLGNGRVVMSAHLGDLDTREARDNAAEAMASYMRLFQVEPQGVACDLHPDYASTARAEALAGQIGVEPVRVQHHHAHIASVMAEHGLRGSVVGIALDGTGLGIDGTVWGGEVLVADENRADRAAHIALVCQPGGDRCAREGWRMVPAYLGAAGSDAVGMPRWWGRPPVATSTWSAVATLAASDVPPLSSSAGRLFDAVASLLDIAHESTYEGEAAMRLETAARRSGAAPAMAVDVHEVADCLVLDTVGLVRALAKQRAAGGDSGVLAATFHSSLGTALADLAMRVAVGHGIDRVALSGGCFQNRLLLAVIVGGLRQKGMRVYANSRVPANDGGISVGQALVLAASQAEG